ncbi:MAG: amidohydrolase family protein, partial [Alphaproteobacteria bacterium]|nr:amidohydrolase family protein [Alphaproteobacteria bacterium]
DVLVEGNRIVAVQPAIKAEAQVIDATNMIVLPGFTDTHHHFYQSALRNLIRNGLLTDYFRDIVNKATPLYRAEDAYDGVLAGALRSVSAGITHVTDLSQVSNSPQHSDAMIKAFKDSGVRAVHAYSRGYGPGAKFPGDLTRLQKQHFGSSDALVTLALGAGINKEQWLLARKHGLRIYTHVVGTLAAVAPAAVIKLGEEGLMGPDNVYIHFTNARDEHMKRVKETGGHISLSVPIEMTMRHGTPPIQQALDHGIMPSLSSDVETTMAADMFSQMRATFTLQRMLINERAIKEEKNLPKLLTAKDVVAMATIEGARCNGAEARTGSLTPGKDADIIMLRTDLTNVLPFNNAYGAIVTGMDTSNVDTVMVAGRVLKRNGRLTGVNLAALNKRLRASRDYIAQQAGWPTSVIDTTTPGR